VNEFSTEWVEQHDCVHPEVLIETGDFGPDDVLQSGMAVLIPCPVCGETPHDSMGIEQARNQELQEALLAHEPDRALFHWSPRARRGQIERYGLRPNMRSTTSSTRLGGPFVCFADSPLWAWALSGNMRWTPKGEWDLWETTLSRLTDPIVLASPERASGIYEVRVEHRVYKRNLRYIGSRSK